jgi:ABC-2 type transport system ATP-binding protein
MNNSPAISVKEVKKTYVSPEGDIKEALKSINLDIARGKFFGLLGPNGAGKSSLINILAGVINKSSGTISVCGYDLDKDSKNVKLSLGCVPQEIVIDPFFTVEEMLDIYAGFYGVPKNQRRTQAIINALGLEDKAKVKPRSLSGGMKRRLLVAKALVHNPKVLILDEPTAGVDIELRKKLWEYVVELNKNGTTIILTTHYLEEAQELCDEIAIIVK